MKTIDPMRELLSRLKIDGFDSDAYLRAHSAKPADLPNIGIAVSGGGYRALLNGAGALAAFDARTPGATEPGHLGGLLQSATYLSGLSGGGWLVSSIYSNNFSSVVALRDASANTEETGVWRFGRSIVEGPDTGSTRVLTTPEYLNQIYHQVQGKRDAGFEASITDYWGRGLAFQLVDYDDGGPGHTWSSLALQPGFNAGDMPLPVIVANGRKPGEVIVSANATVFEFTPWEMGSFDSSLFGMAPLAFVGSNFSRGRATQDCVTGFDSVSLVLGTSSSLFNFALMAAYDLKVPSFLSGALKDIVDRLGEKNDDIAEWSPNPFAGWNMDDNVGSGGDRLFLVDGGEDGENVPFYPHIQRQRAVDVIFAVDGSADTTYNWPNGTAMVATSTRLQQAHDPQLFGFPPVPDYRTFINLGLNRRPTFFGCDGADAGGGAGGGGGGPLIVYLPNTPYTYNSNVSTFDLSYSPSERDAIVGNAYNVATQANGTVDAAWPACVACAVLARSFARAAAEVPAQCGDCFARYCWNGTTNSSDPGSYEPAAIVGISGAAVGPRAHVEASLAVVAAAVVAAVNFF